MLCFSETRMSKFASLILFNVKETLICTILCTAKVEQALRPALNLIFCHFNCADCVLKSQKHFILAVNAVCRQLNFECSEFCSETFKRFSKMWKGDSVHPSVTRPLKPYPSNILLLPLKYSCVFENYFAHYKFFSPPSVNTCTPSEKFRYPSNIFLP